MQGRASVFSQVVGLVLGLLVLGLVSCSEAREPFFGTHQSGIVTGAQKFAFVAAFDLTTNNAPSENRDELRNLLKSWTNVSEALTQGRPVGTEGPATIPPGDTGETLGYRPARLTLTFGVGPSLFDGRFGLADRRPAALLPMPAFAGDQLRPEWSNGDLVVQVAADDYQTAYHALHALTRAAKGLAVVRWVQDGFQPGLEVNPRGPGRNLQGFIDGTVNPDPTSPEAMNKVVWADQGSDWMAGGTYLVVRRIRMFVEVWDRSSLADQQTTIGRDRTTGKELPEQEADSHVQRARGSGAEKILRRPFHYVNGLDSHTGQWDSGLLFLAWMKDPQQQFVPMQTRLSGSDLLNEYIQVQASAVFAVFPGVRPGSYLGEPMVPEPPLSARIEALLSEMGVLYPALGREDWDQVRRGAKAWEGHWNALKAEAGDRAAAIDTLQHQWSALLANAGPASDQVRSTQSQLIRALGDWKNETTVNSSVAKTDHTPLSTALSAVEQALKSGQSERARAAFAEFQKAWVKQEALVRSADSAAYAAIERGIAVARHALGATGASNDALASVEALASVVNTLSKSKGFGAWDAGFLLFREGLEALLVLAALLTFLGKTGQSGRVAWVWAGAGSGLAAAVVAALGISVLMNGWIAASAPALIEGLVGLVAVLLMLTVGLWLHGKSTVKNWNLWMKDQMGKVGNSTWALAGLAFVAVLREGAETVVFFWGMAGSLSTADLLLGIAGALAVLAGLGTAMIGFSKRLPLQWFFPLATALIYLLAVKILGQSIVSLQTAGWVSLTPLGFGAPLDWAGFSATWESALPQVALLVGLGTLVIGPLVAEKPKSP